jgi:hypothetical protein
MNWQLAEAKNKFNDLIHILQEMALCAMVYETAL